MRYEVGTPSLPAVAGLAAALELLLLGDGILVVRDWVFALIDRLAAGLQGKGYRLNTSPAPGDRSGILSFSGESIAAVHARLEAANLSTYGSRVALSCRPADW